MTHRIVHCTDCGTVVVDPGSECPACGNDCGLNGGSGTWYTRLDTSRLLEGMKDV